MYLTRLPLARSDDGQVLAIVAVSMVVLLLFAALVFDVGNWFSHKRQLQNRADAGALAAGVEYQKSWASCVSGNATTETTISNNARAYAGDPIPTVPVITPVNTETASQANLNVWINSTSYDSATPDGGGPCFNHPADPTDPISPAGGYWTDVKVKERDLASFFGSLGIPLTRNIARARVAVHPAISDNGFVPLAIPDYRINKAQARFINGCTGLEIGSPVPLAPLDTTVVGNPSVAGTALWVPDNRPGLQPNPVTPVSAPDTFQLTVPAIAPGNGCGGPGNNSQDYIPVEVQVRVTGRPDIDINAPCATLQSQTSADCFSDLTEIRAYTGGTLRQRPIVSDVTFGGSITTPCTQDAYYARLQPAQSNCRFDAVVNMDWDTRPGNANAFSAILHVGSSNTNYTLSPVTPKPGAGIKWVSEWRASGIPISSIGAKDITVEWDWNGPNNGTWTPSTGPVVPCTNGGNNQCDQNGTLTVHRVSLGDDPSGNSAPLADIVGLVKVTAAANVSSQFASTPAMSTSTMLTRYLFVGLRSTITVGDFGILRNGNSSGTQSLICDPDYTGGQTYQMFRDGCKPPYSYNLFNDYWWDVGAQHCPPRGQWFQQPNANGDYLSEPWKCIPTDTGSSGYQVVDGLATRTGNCVNPQNNSCAGHNYTCTNAIFYQNANNPFANANDPRIIKIYVIPYGALKNTTGNDEIPVIDFAAFYVTAWKFQNAVDPCGPGGTSPDTAKLGDNEVGGYFIRYVGPDTGPVDLNVICDANQTRPCRAVLVR